MMRTAWRLSAARAAEGGGGAIPAEHLGHGDRAALVLEVLHDREQGPGGGPGPVERVHEFELPVPAEPDVQPARLVVGGVRARRDLAVALLGREPRLDVVLL